MIKSTGTVAYKGRWCVLECDYELGRYLRRLLTRSMGIKLQKPSWNEHITVVSSLENPLGSAPNWLCDQDKELSFYVHMTLYTNGNAFWYNVWSSDLIDLRRKFGLEESPIPLHFCIGYLHANEEPEMLYKEQLCPLKQLQK